MIELASKYERRTVMLNSLNIGLQQVFGLFNRTLVLYLF